ncbi:MAG: cation transporter [Acidimicrobiales bacterium]|nr:cation transporter [Acidimicrobiales bacterium]
MAGELTVAILASSVALMADTAHMLIDASGLALAVWVARISKKAPTGNWTYGFQRAEIVSAAINGIALLVISALIAYESISRLLHPIHVTAFPVLIVALVGVAFNSLTTFIVSRADRSNMNVEGAFQHLLTDLFGFIGTAIAALIILWTHFNRADSIASLLVVLIMLFAAYRLLKDSGRILFEAAPTSVDIAEIKNHLLDLESVQDVHDLHFWNVTAALPAISAHIVVTPDCLENGSMGHVLDQLQDCLIGHFDVEHSTFQLEPPEHAEHEPTMHG